MQCQLIKKILNCLETQPAPAPKEAPKPVRASYLTNRFRLIASAANRFALYHGTLAEAHHRKEKPRIDEPPAAVRQHLNRTDQAQRKTLLKPKAIPGVENWGIPPEPETPCDPGRLASPLFSICWQVSDI